jgi:hypothetical protein
MLEIAGLAAGGDDPQLGAAATERTLASNERSFSA